MTRWWIALGFVFIAGAVLAAAGGETLDIIGISLGGVAAVGAISLAFLAVGRSEDRARAEEEAQRRGSGPPGGAANGDGRLESRRLPRRRDH
jgi:small neutral amino acid transporter SnatA (MarC family)